MSSVLVVATPIVLLGGAGSGCPDLPSLVRRGGCGQRRCPCEAVGAARAWSRPTASFLWVDLLRVSSYRVRSLPLAGMLPRFPHLPRARHWDSLSG